MSFKLAQNGKWYNRDKEEVKVELESEQHDRPIKRRKMMARKGKEIVAHSDSLSEEAEEAEEAEEEGETEEGETEEEGEKEEGMQIEEEGRGRARVAQSKGDQASLEEDDERTPTTSPRRDEENIHEDELRATAEVQNIETPICKEGDFSEAREAGRIEEEVVPIQEGGDTQDVAEEEMNVFEEQQKTLFSESDNMHLDVADEPHIILASGTQGEERLLKSTTLQDQQKEPSEEAVQNEEIQG